MATVTNVTVIGRTTHVRGRLSGDGDFQIDGVVLGEITTLGQVTVDGHGVVGANVQGRKLVVRGAVQGDLVAAEAVVLEQGARVVGDVRSPRIVIAEGALMRGEVHAGEEGDGQAAAVRGASHARPAAAEASRVGPSANRVSPPALARSERGASPPAGSKSSASAASPAAPKSPGSVAAPSKAVAPEAEKVRRPPPPVVPVLKKAKGQVLKKKER